MSGQHSRPVIPEMRYAHLPAVTQQRTLGSGIDKCSTSESQQHCLNCETVHGRCRSEPVTRCTQERGPGFELMPFPMTHPCAFDVTHSFSYITTMSLLCVYIRTMSLRECAHLLLSSAHYCNNTCIIQHYDCCFTSQVPYTRQ